MAKTILRHGYNQKVCYCTCGCIFAYEDSDTIVEPTQGYARTAVESTAIKYVICPECGARLYICSYTPPVTIPAPLPQSPEPYYIRDRWPNDGGDYWPYLFSPFYCGNETIPTDGTTASSNATANISMTLYSNSEETENK